MVQNRGTALAEFHIQKEPSTSAKKPRLIAKPRQLPVKSMLVRAFNVLKLQGLQG
jgi:hypothetical protein